MKINKEFINKILSFKEAYVYELIEDMYILTYRKDSVGPKIIINSQSVYKQLEQIYYTINFLEEEGLIGIDNSYCLNNKINFGVPTINPIDFIDKKGEPMDKYIVQRMDYIEEINKTYWNKKIIIRLELYDFVDNCYMTSEERKYLRDTWLPIIVAVIVSVLTALFTVLFNKHFQ